MNVVQSASAIKAPKQEVRSSSTKSTVNLYGDSPKVELTLDDFEVYALKRLKVLRKIEQLKTMRVSPDIFKERVDKVIQENISDATIDEVSHFILRLSYCQSDELRRWFLTQETHLFQHRLRSLPVAQLTMSVRKYAQIKPIPREEKDELRDHLMKLSSVSLTDFKRANFYAVPFQQALDLVASRQCYLSRGSAYIAEAKVLTILVSKFRSELSRCLAIMSNSNSFSAEDPESGRIYPLLKNLSNCMVNHEPEDQALATGLTAATADSMVGHMPLCMRQLQDGMKADKKLKHWGRLQYGLFLKGAGMSMEDALLFFQRHFSLVTGEKFQKEYAYNIRHMYGKEGKRASYTPYNCGKIIMGNAPSSGDHHGCPYRHYDDQAMRSMLQRLNIGNEQDRRNIMNLKSSGQYQLACHKHFEVSHPKALALEGVMDNVGNHPNAWFRASVQYKEKSTEAVAVSPEK